MDCSSPGLPVPYHLLELAQTHVHQFSDAIQPSHPLSFPSPPAFNVSQHQGLFKWVSSLHQVAKFKSINSSMLIFLYSPTLTSIHDCWKNHSFDYIDLCRQSNVSPFKMLSRFVIAFLLFKSVFLKGVSVFYFHDCSHPHSDFAAPKNKVSHCFHCFSIYLPWSDGTGCHELHFF